MIKRVEINYRGVFQKTLGRKIGGDLVLIARRLDKVGFSNGRYSDAPERNGLPSKYFTFISSTMTEAELEAECGGKLDIDAADVTVVLDDTLLAGVEPWAWHGIRPVNEKTQAGGALIVVSRHAPDDLIPRLERKPYTYHLAVLAGETSLSGMWVFRDDLTHERVLGAIAAVDPSIVTIEAVEQHLLTRADGTARAAAARAAYDEVTTGTTTVQPTDGRVWPFEAPSLPSWQGFREAATVVAVPRQGRNVTFPRGTSKTERPVVRFDLCTKCTLCWLDCPDGAFDPVAGGHYDVDYAYCSGCGKCAEVCPVKDCIVMVDELRFDDTVSPWAAYQRDAPAYLAWAEEKTSVRPPERPHVSGRMAPVTTSSRS